MLLTLRVSASYQLHIACAMAFCHDDCVILQTYKDFVDTSPPGNCSVPLNVLNAPGNYTPLCATAEVYAPGQPPSYCPPKGTQPYYSAYR